MALAAAELEWRHVVVTSVTRDDLTDGGASHFAAVVRAIREKSPGTTVELLVPDFQGDREALGIVVEVRPEVLAHNVETVPRIYAQFRPQAEYMRSLELIRQAKTMDPAILLKSGLMVGVGESETEVREVLQDLYTAGCRAITIGQYLPPSQIHAPLKEYRSLEFFETLKAKARRIGFPHVLVGPLIRSSYKAKGFVFETRSWHKPAREETF